ncbi:uncharacterized protein LOC135479628 isoform X2 [Liolophura sinensis]
MDQDDKSRQQFLETNNVAARPPTAKSAKKGDPLIAICICLITLIIVLLSCLVIAQIRRRSVPACSYPKTFCLPCESLRLSPGENKYHFKDFGHDRVDRALDQDCCAENPKDLQRLVEIFVKRKQRIQRLKELAIYNGRNTPEERRVPATHLVKLTPSIVTINANRGKEVEWDDSDDNLSFLQRFTRKGHTVIIPEKGYYYVYSQLIFEEASNSSTVLSSACHVLMRQSAIAGVPVDELMTNSVTITGGVSEASSSYLGAVFELMKNDTIWIQVRGRGARLNPIKHAHGNYFGLYKV